MFFEIHKAASAADLGVGHSSSVNIARDDDGCQQQDETLTGYMAEVLDEEAHGSLWRYQHLGSLAAKLGSPIETQPCQNQVCSGLATTLSL